GGQRGAVAESAVGRGGVSAETFSGGRARHQTVQAPKHNSNNNNNNNNNNNYNNNNSNSNNAYDVRRRLLTELRQLRPTWYGELSSDIKGLLSRPLAELCEILKE
ncbi:unnamed protein product, partial [Polarella glacialis]